MTRYFNQLSITISLAYLFFFAIVFSTEFSNASIHLIVLLLSTVLAIRGERNGLRKFAIILLLLAGLFYITGPLPDTLNNLALLDK